jgi:hypothetical protein
VLLAVAAVLVLTYLPAAQIVLARRTRRRLNPGLVAASALTAVLIAWSLTATLLERGQVATGATPRAQAAADVTLVRADAVQVDLDDRLTQADHGEDCLTTTSTNRVTCAYEQDALKYLQAAKGHLPADLTTAADDSQDAAVRQDLATAETDTKTWLADENALPTLQNLSTSSTAYGLDGRNSTGFLQQLLPRYTSDPTPYYTAVIKDDQTFEGHATQAATAEWGDYAGQAGGGGDTLAGLVIGGLLLGLLAGAAAGAGVGRRVAEYWSGGGSNV